MSSSQGSAPGFFPERLTTLCKKASRRGTPAGARRTRWGKDGVFSRWCWATGQSHATQGRRTLAAHAHARGREVAPRPARQSQPRGRGRNGRVAGRALGARRPRGHTAGSARGSFPPRGSAAGPAPEVTEPARGSREAAHGRPAAGQSPAWPRPAAAPAPAWPPGSEPGLRKGQGPEDHSRAVTVSLRRN